MKFIKLNYHSGAVLTLCLDDIIICSGNPKGSTKIILRNRSEEYTFMKNVDEVLAEVFSDHSDSGGYELIDIDEDEPKHIEINLEDLNKGEIDFDNLGDLIV